MAATNRVLSTKKETRSEFSLAKIDNCHAMSRAHLALAYASARYWRKSADVRLMHIIRWFFISLIAVASVCGDDAAAPQSSAKTKPAPDPPGITLDWIHVDGPYIALTFDDGPSAKLTPKLLDLLAAHHIKVTFFLIGENVAEHPDVVAREAREGHELANHSWSHPNFGKMSDESVRSQIRRTDDAIRNAAGVTPTLLRPPYGSVTARQKKWINQEFGYKIALWDVDPLDWKRPGPNVVCNRIVRNTRAGSIVLVHDIHPGSIEAMPCVLNQLEAKGFKFVTVSELLAMETPVPPKPSASPKAAGAKPPPTLASPNN